MGKLLSIVVVGLVAVLAADADHPSAATTSPHTYLVTALDGSNVLEIVRGGRVARVVARGLILGSGSWSADGSFLAWTQLGTPSENLDRRLTLWIARGDGSNPRRVVQAAKCTICGFGFDWAQRGHTLVLANADGHGKRVLLIDAVSGAKKDITPAREPAHTYLGSPAWSPSGKLIAYARHGVSGTSKGADCWLAVGAPGADRLRTLRHLHYKDCPDSAWSPDGRRISFTTDGWGDPRFPIVDVATGALRRLNVPHGMTVPPVWSPDGRRLAYSIEGGVLTVAADGTSPRRVPVTGSGFSNPVPVAWSSDGVITLIRRNEIIETTDSSTTAARVVYRAPTSQSILALDRR